MREIRESPFTPGNPVPVDLFVGRKKQIQEIHNYLKQTIKGRQENIFLSGERGIGKSSLASFLKNLALKENFLAIHSFLGGVNKPEELVKIIFEEILKEIKGDLKDKILNYFGKFRKYIREVGILGVSVSFNPPESELKDLTAKFPEILAGLLAKIKEDKKSGLFIALDDINGLAKDYDFANWYKSFVDKISVTYKDFSIFIMPIGLPEVRDALAQHQPSLLRIFRVIEIDKLSDEEVKEFFQKAFNKAMIKTEKKAIELMVKYSGGLPILMQEIGDAVFWEDIDCHIDLNDATDGIISAAERIGKKYLDPKVYRAIRSTRYKSILRKLGEDPIGIAFTKREIEEKLDENEKKVFHNFLTKMRELGIIISDKERGKGSYKFVNNLYPVYIYLESQRYKRKLKRS